MKKRVDGNHDGSIQQQQQLKIKVLRDDNEINLFFSIRDGDREREI